MLAKIHPETLIAGVMRDHSDEILLSGFFGSQEKDLDVIIILERSEWDLFKALCAEIKAALPRAHIFPTYRLQSCQFSASGSFSSNIHLLVYPSLTNFLETERPFIRYCMARSIKLVDGHADAVFPREHPRPKPCMEVYRSLLYETAQVFWTSALGEWQCEMTEVQHKLLYILKFALLEAYYKVGDPVDFNNIGNSVFAAYTNKTALAEEGRFLYKRVIDWKNPKRSTVDGMMDACSHWLERLAGEL